MEAIFSKTALKITIWVFFRGLKSKSGYFLGFSKKISDELTYHFYIKTAPPPGIRTPPLRFSDDQFAPLIQKILNKIEKTVLLDQFYTFPPLLASPSPKL